MRESHSHLFACCIPQQSLPIWKAIRFVPQEESRKRHFYYAISEIKETFEKLSSSSSSSSSSQPSYFSLSYSSVDMDSPHEAAEPSLSASDSASLRLVESNEGNDKEKNSLSKEKEKKEKVPVCHLMCNTPSCF